MRSSKTTIYLVVWGVGISAAGGNVSGQAPALRPVAEPHWGPITTTSLPFAVDTFAYANSLPTFAGTLVALGRDDLLDNRSDVRYVLQGDGEIALHRALLESISPLPTPRFPVTEDVLRLDLSARGHRSSIPPKHSHIPKVGEQRTLVVLFNFLDNADEPFTVADAAEIVFGTASPETCNSRILAYSLGKAWLAGDVLGWITLPVNQGDPECEDYNNLGTFHLTIDLLDPLVDFALYDRFIFLEDRGLSLCFSASGTVYDRTIYTDEGRFDVSVATSPVGDSVYEDRTLTHELGHNFGLSHVHTLECGELATGDVGSTCEVSMQRDRFDTMGMGWGHFNAVTIEWLDWFYPYNIAVAAPGTSEFLLEPLELPTDGIQVVKIPARYHLWGWTRYSRHYFVEYRQAYGYDRFYDELADPAVGVLVHLDEHLIYGAPDFKRSCLLDMTPHETSDELTQAEDSAESWLPLGETFYDDKYGISIEFTGVTDDGAMITVHFDGDCCLPDGSCVDVSFDSCLVMGGTPVNFCSADCDGDGRDDVCDAFTDCDDNLIPDQCDILYEDCNVNAIPDGCEPDCNRNGEPDDCDLALGHSEDCNMNGVPDDCDPYYDCNDNDAQDICDVAGGTSEDCDFNEVPDECEPDEDCNSNGNQDICDIAAGVSADCQANAVPDECDISAGTSEDVNSNGIPDECERPPTVEPGGPPCGDATDCVGAYAGADCAAGSCYVPKNRYLSIDPTTNPYPVAYRLEIVAATDYPTALGRSWWVAEPICYDYPNGDPVPSATTCEGADRFGWVSTLEAVPVTRTWIEAPLQVTGCAVAPAVTFEVRASANDGGGFSEPLEISTAHNPDGDSQSWGDITGGPVPGLPGLWLPPERVTNFSDVGNAIRTFENRTEETGSPPFVWVDVEVNQVVNLGDVQFIVEAFEGKAYAAINLPLIGIHPADCP